MLRLVMFDLDGVLVDACEWHRLALNEALKEICDYEIPLEEHYTTFNGIPTRVKLNKLTEKGIVAASDHDRIYGIKQDKTIEIIKNKAHKALEKIRLMEWLKENSISIACVTNSIRESGYLMLERTGIASYFDHIITNQDVEKPKPSPEGYNKALHYFNITPEDAIIVEDSPKGLTAAYATGCKVLKVKDATQVTISTLKEFIDENFDSHGR
jgi:HAD superfamily hydrolase (TIGR01509 family)